VTQHAAHGAQDALFDLADLARASVAATPWQGAPLTYTTDYHDPADLDAAFDRYRAEFGEFGCAVTSGMWHRDLFDKTFGVGGHQLVRFAAHLDGVLLHQIICPACCWHAIGSENEVVEAWHDHAMPGWRELPVLPTFKGRDERRQKAAALAWLAEHYPIEWQFDGAPVITQRSPYGTRHVPGRSPLGGYDFAATPDA